MLLSKTAEYALRAMTHLALLAPGKKIGVRELSKATRIPLHYLSKIMRRLVVRRLVLAQKGHGGGFTLSRPAGQIRFSDILQAVGFAFESDHCMFGLGSCQAAQPCPLHQPWSRMKEEFKRWSETTALSSTGNQPQ